MHLFIKMGIFVSKLERHIMSVKLCERQSSITVPYTSLVVFETLSEILLHVGCFWYVIPGW